MRFESRVAGGWLALGIALLGDAARHQRRVSRLGQDDLRLGAFAPQHPADAGNGPAGAVTGDEVVKPLPVKIGDDLARRGVFVDVGIGLGLELVGQEPAMCLGQFLRLLVHAETLQLLRGKNHPGAQEPHQLAPLDREAFGHRHHQRIALHRAGHGQPDAGIAAGCLDNGLPRFQRAALFGRLDDVHRQPVLDRPGRIERLELDVNRDVIRRDPVDADAGRVAHRVKYVVVKPAAPFGLSCHPALQPVKRPAPAGGRFRSIPSPAPSMAVRSDRAEAGPSRPRGDRIRPRPRFAPERRPPWCREARP